MEDRQLLAADLAARFEFTNSAGSVVSSLQPGQDFLLRMYVRDVRSNPQGVFQAYFDVNYNASLVSVNGPITHGLEYAASGTTAGSTGTAGLIDDVGGKDTDQFRPTPRDADLLLFSVPFRANQTGTLPLTVDEADRPDRIVLFFDTVAGLPLNKIDFTGPGFNNVPPIEIVNPNATLLAVSAASAAKSEGNAGSTPFTFTVTRTGVTTGTTTVNYAVAGTGTDQANAADFGGTLPSGTVSFAAGETSKTITVNVSGDTTVEANEGFSVTLSNPSGIAQITTATAVGTIQNDDTALTIAAAAAAKPEGNTDTTPLTFTVARTGLLTGTTTVNYAVAGIGTNPANAADFGGLLPSGVVSFAAGETNKTITVNVSGDTVVEQEEGFSVTLSNASGGAQILTATAAGTIQNDDTALTIAVAAAAKPEGNTGTTPLTFTVSRTGLLTGTTTVNYAVAGIGANPANAADFGGTLPSGLVSFAVDETSKTITVNASGDTLVEPDEGFSVTLSNASGGAQVLTAMAAGTILNDDTAVAITVADAAKAEGNAGSTPFTFTVTRTGLLTGTTTVNYAVAGTGANPVNAADFGGTLPSGVASFAAGETSKTITVNGSGDTTVEFDEGFSVTLSNASGGATILTATAAGTIQNDDTVLAIAAAGAVKAEGNTGTTPFTFTVTRTGLLTGTTTVNYTVAGTGANPANAADFGGTLPSGVVSFAAGETSKTITVNASGETTAEPDEGFSVTLSNASGGAQITTATAVGTIQNDDTALAITAADAAKPEGNSVSTPFTFTVTRTGLTTGTTTVSYAVAGTGANPANAADFGGALPSGVVSFAAGETGKTITVNVSGDITVESDESFSVTLSNASGGAQILTAMAAGTILNDDTAVAIAVADAAKAEGNTSSTAFTFTVTRSGLTTGTTTVSYAVAGTGANPANAADFGGTLPSGVVSFAAGETSKTITVNVSGDTTVEFDEGFSVTLSNASGGAAILAATAAGTIQNDDTVLAIAAAGAVKAEGNTGTTPFTFTVTRTGLLTGTTTVNYAVAGTGANPANAADFGGTLPSGVVSFAAGETSKTITVNASGETTAEPDEGFSVTLSNASGGAQITTATAVGTIQNDDTGLAITAADAARPEGTSGSTPFTFTVTRTGLTTGTTTVSYAVAGTGANPANAADFGGTLPSGAVSFAAGETTKTITVNVSGDTTVEPDDEGFSVTLSNASGGAQITTATAVGTIQNDDIALAIAVADAAKTEGNAGTTPFTFTVTRTGLATGTTTVSYAVAGTGANPANAADFGGALPSGVVSFAAGETSKTITVNVSGDTTVEFDEEFSVTLSNASGGAQITTATAVGTIQNDDTALVIAAADAVKAEGNTGTTPFTFTVTRTGLITGTTTVNYAVAGTGANPANAADFGGTLPTGVVSFAAGETIKTITVNVTVDTTVESDEGFSVTLSNASGGAQITTATASGTIQNDDEGLALAATDTVKAEGNAGNTAFTFTVTRAGLTTGTTTVSYTVAGTGANPANAADFGGTLPSGVVIFAAGETSTTITVHVSGDTTAEPDEGFSVTLSNPSGSVQITATTASGTIQNDDIALAIAAANAVKPEGSTGNTAFTLTVTRTGLTTGTTTVNYAVTGTGPNPADSADFGGTLPSGAVSFAAGETSKTFTVNVSGDTAVEPDEGFSVTLSNASGGAQIVTATASGTIQNDDTALAIAAADTAKPEGNTGSTPLTFTVTRTGLLTGTTTVNYAVAGRGANPADAADFGGTLPSGVVSFAASETSKTITVNASGDTVVEPDEGFSVTLSGASGGAQITAGTADGSIRNDDTAIVSISGPPPVDEGDAGTKLLEFTITLSAPVDVPVSVDYATADGAAENQNGDHDYQSAQGTHTFQPGGTLTQTVTVTVQGDTVLEHDETFQVVLSNLRAGTPARSVSLGNAAATATIVDDDAARLTITVTQHAAEDATHGLFTIATDRLLSEPVQVILAVTGTATPGADYMVLGTELTFPANTASVTVPVTVLPDELIEGSETVIVRITGTNAPAARPGTPDSATLTIADEDVTTVSIAAADSMGSESGADDGQFVVALGKGKIAPPQGITVSYSAGGSASPGADYVTLSGKVTILGGQTSATILVQVRDDDVVEFTETVTASLLGTDNAGATIDPVNDTATVSIGDDDRAEVSIAQVVDGDEGETLTPGKFRVTQSQVSSTDTVLGYSVNGTATPGAGHDYTPLSGTVTIPAGATTADIEVAVLDDAVVEGTETVSLTLVTVSGHPEITIGAPATASLDIADNDRATVSIATTTDGAETGPVHGVFTVTQTAASSTDTVLTYTLGGTAASGLDFTALSGTVTILAGATTATITVPVLDDVLVEGPETVSLTLATVSGHPEITIGAAATASLDIADNDRATVSIAKTTDGDETGPVHGVFTVTQTAASSTDTVLTYTLGGTAAAGGDFTALSGTVTILAGATTAMIAVPVLDDTLVEDTETVRLTLVTVSGRLEITIGAAATASLDIADNDRATVSIAKTTDGAETGPMNGVFTVTQTAASSTDTVLTYTVGGTAASGLDFTALSGAVTILAGATTATITVPVLDDALVEGQRTVSLTLATISGDPEITFGAPATASLDIADNDSATLSIAKTMDGAETGPVHGVFTVTQTAASSTDTVLTYTVGGTAAAGVDFTALSGTVTVLAGSTEADIVVPVLNDLLVEQPETVVVTLSAVISGAPAITVGLTDTTATVSIVDEPASVSVAAAAATLSEPGPGQGQFLVALAGGRQAPLGGIQVSYTVSGSAVAGADYTTLSGVTTIPAGQSSVPIPVAVLNDNVVELPETVVVTLTGTDHPNVSIGPAGNQATVTIGDDDPTTVSIAASDPSGSEPGGDGGQFSVTLDGGKVAPTGGIVVTYTVSGTATSGVDYTTLAGSVTIPAGLSSAAIPVDVLDDNVIEARETVIVTLTATDHPRATVHATNRTATVTIDSADDNTTVSISATDGTGREPGTDDAQFTVTLGGGKVAPEGGIVVNYTVRGTATAGSDFTALPAAVTIPAGASSATIAVDVLDDNVVEGPETVIVALTGTNHTGITIAPANHTATATIEDDDPTTVAISPSDANAAEPGDNGLFTVTLGNGKVAPPGGITVNYAVSGSATAGTDYTPLPGTVTIPAGASSATIPVAVLDDNVVELAETVIVTLTGTSHTGVTVANANNAATVTIADGGPTTVSITASDAAGGEPGTDDGAFTVTLDGGKVAPTGGIAVTYTIGGTATAGVDYTTLTGTVTIPAGQSSIAIPVDVLDDNVVEVAETVFVTLTGTNHAGATIHTTNKAATVTIDSADDAAIVSLSVTDATGREPGADDAQFTVTLSGGKLAPAGGIAVTYTTSGTATAGSDFTALTGTVTIPAGASSATIAVDVLDDNVVEYSETVLVTLTGTNHTGATIATAAATATADIEDDDATTVSISASEIDAAELDTDSQFTVTLDNDKVAPPGGIVVSYTTAGTATPGSDYTALTGSVTILAGQPSATIVVDVIADTTADEPAETVSVTLTSANHPSVTLSTDNRTATVTIAADDLRNASISGIVWIDANNDRQQQKDTAGNPLEPGIPEVTVRLTGTARDGSTLNLQAMTDDDGVYRFIDLPAGTYEVREEQPVAWIDGQEMLTSSTVNDTYSNIVLTPGQQAENYSFGERTLQPQFISKRQFLASTPVTEVYLREVNALAKQRAGDTAGAQAIRDASIPSEVSAKSVASTELAQDGSLAGESDAAQLAAGESTPAAQEAAPGGEGEASLVSPVPVAKLVIREAVAGRVGTPASATVHGAAPNFVSPPVSRAVPTIASGSAATSKIAPVNADPPPAVSPVSTKIRDLRRPMTFTGSSRSSQAETHRPVLTAHSVSERAPSLPRRKADQNLDMAELVDLVDLVFAEDQWLARPST